MVGRVVLRGPQEGAGVAGVSLSDSTEVAIEGLSVGTVDEEVGLLVNLLQLPLVVVGVG